MSKSCCITGHNNLLVGQIDYVKEELSKHILIAIQDGFTHFISGFAGGADFYFANIVADLKDENPNITLEAAIPFHKRIEASDVEFQRLIKLCDKINVISEIYNKSCYLVRNMYMVNQSERVIAVYDGRVGGGTAFTIQYAQAISRELYIITI